jgi:hypothetical protein
VTVQEIKQAMQGEWVSIASEIRPSTIRNPDCLIEDSARRRLQQDFLRDSNSEPFSVAGRLSQQKSIGRVLSFRDDDLHSKYRIARTLQ